MFTGVEEELITIPVLGFVGSDCGSDWGISMGLLPLSFSRAFLCCLSSLCCLDSMIHFSISLVPVEDNPGEN